MKSPIDFTRMWDEAEGYAVHCSSSIEAETFVDWVRILFPSMCEHWGPNETNYSKNEDETIYTLEIRRNNKWSKSKLMYGSLIDARRLGYKIIEFSDIFQEEEINESEASLDVLFG